MPQKRMTQVDLPKYLYTIERDLIERALDATSGHKTLAAKLLGIPRTTLVMKIKKFKILYDNPKRKTVN